MAKIITEISIDNASKQITINTKEQIEGEQYLYSSKEAALSDADLASLLAIITTYLG